jgi:hypothetical protein
MQVLRCILVYSETEHFLVAELPISQELADKLLRYAEHHNRSLEDLLTGIMESESADQAGSYAQLVDDPRYQQAERRILPKLFARARAYWKSVGDQERLALTDDQLYEQFWLIDPDGIPRLKSDQGQIDLPPDPFEAAANRQWQRWQKNGQAKYTGTEDIDARSVLNEELAQYLLRSCDF